MGHSNKKKKNSDAKQRTQTNPIHFLKWFSMCLDSFETRDVDNSRTIKETNSDKLYNRIS